MNPDKLDEIFRLQRELTPDEIFEAYTKKHRVNVARQESGYTTKNEADNRHI